MTSETLKRWIEAGKLIALDGNADATCPVCQSSRLQVRDEFFEGNRSLRERHMTCPSCGARNSLLLKRRPG
jgi:Zn finger protein HypA/HybF involved in hydrogenase expression